MMIWPTHGMGGIDEMNRDNKEDIKNNIKHNFMIYIAYFSVQPSELFEIILEAVNEMGFKIDRKGFLEFLSNQ